MATAFVNTPFELPGFETNYSISNPRSKPIILTPFLRLSSELQFFYQSKELDAEPYLKISKSLFRPSGNPYIYAHEFRKLRDFRKLNVLSYSILKSQREHMERLLSRCTSVLGVQIWSPDPALVKAVREMFCFCIHVVCQMQLFARSPIFEGQPGRHFFEMVGRLREKSDPLSQACLKIFEMDLSLITQESHATSCCPICQLDHQTPHYSKLLHPEDEGGAALKILPPLNEIPRLSKPDECAICYGPNYTPVATIPCGHKHTCLTCIIRWTKSEEEAPPNGCPYCRSKIARLELLVPYPRFQVEESRTKSKYSLARPFAEAEMGYEEMEKRQKEVMEVVTLVGAWIWRVPKEDRNFFVAQRRWERRRWRLRLRRKAMDNKVKAI
ncbi:uncharacterized protein EAF02_009202 [Botrytis sinoallii]|uniref:uncharacterized protein n=1 Tax=Botrytis sinoallii TaxID=1463999 RepID=UPI00190095F7|nr:uncharacterized protein EAF02_009202 [Botrytis sinoallii]KAF7872097.1 hypothetical protein EAF02_009202 [Botrytis sinoallii]